MRLHLLAALFVAPLCACATGPSSTWATPQAPGAATAVAVGEMPLFIASKITICLARTPLLGPAAITSAIVPFSDSKDGSGVGYFTNNAQADCGPPYYITASQVSNEP